MTTIDLKYSEDNMLNDVVQFGMAKVMDSYARILNKRLIPESPEIKIIKDPNFLTEFKNKMAWVLIESTFSGGLAGKIFFYQPKSLIRSLEGAYHSSLSNPRETSCFNSFLINSIYLSLSRIFMDQIIHILGIKKIHFRQTPSLYSENNELKKLEDTYCLSNTFLINISTNILHDHSHLNLQIHLILNSSNFNKFINQIPKYQGVF